MAGDDHEGATWFDEEDVAALLVVPGDSNPSVLTGGSDTSVRGRRA